MNPEQIRNIIRSGNNKSEGISTIINYFKVYGKTIKRVVVILTVATMLFKPSIPAKILSNVADAFIHQYVELVKKYK